MSRSLNELKSRRAFLSLLSAGVVTAAVAACSSTPPAAPTTASSGSSAPAATKAPEAGTAATPTAQPASQAAPATATAVHLDYWTLPVGFSADWPNGKWEGQVAQNYTKAHPNVKIDVLAATWDMIEKINTAITAGTPPDLIGRGSHFYLYYALKSGVAMEVELPKDLADDLPEGYAKAMLWKGKNYLVPWYIMADASRVNLTLAKEADAESLLPKKPAMSWNWDDFHNFAKAVARKRPNGQQAWAAALFTQTKVPAYHWLTWQWLWNMGVDMYKDPQNGGEVALNTPTGVKALQYLHDLYYVDKVIPNPASVRDNDIGDYWNQGNLAYQVGAGSTATAHGKGVKINKETMVMTDPGGFDWMIVQNPTSPGVQHQAWGGAGVDVHLQPFKQKSDAARDALLGFCWFMTNKENQEFMAQFQIPVRQSVAKDKLGDDPLAQYTIKYLVPGAHSWLADGNSTKLLDIFNTHFQDLFLGKSPQQVADEFAAEANAAIASNK